jgi:hypothetical protein
MGTLSKTLVTKIARTSGRAADTRFVRAMRDGAPVCIIIVRTGYTDIKAPTKAYGSASTTLRRASRRKLTNGVARHLSFLTGALIGRISYFQNAQRMGERRRFRV